MKLHALTIEECVDTICREDRHAFDAVKRASPRITRLIEAIAPRFLAGGRLIYIGAGTSGRLGVLDASEAPPTFQIEHGRIIGIIAGGDGALRKSSESKEDDPQGSWDELRGLNLSANDSLIGIAAGGTTPYVHGAFNFCKTQLPEGARPMTAMLCCTPIDHPEHADQLLILKTGPEVLTGSTRMKAGTATKLTLNIISTTLMIRLGKVYQNLMVDLKASNAKLRDRAARIVATLTGLDRDSCFALVDAADGSVKTAVVMHRMNLDKSAAEVKIAQANGHLAAALDDSGSESFTPVESSDDDLD
jgi:N-acetylmuramic acid 6-phosphate etherase